MVSEFRQWNVGHNADVPGSVETNTALMSTEFGLQCEGERRGRGWGEERAFSSFRWIWCSFVRSVSIAPSHGHEGDGSPVARPVRQMEEPEVGVGADFCRPRWSSTRRAVPQHNWCALPARRRRGYFSTLCAVPHQIRWMHTCLARRLGRIGTGIQG